MVAVLTKVSESPTGMLHLCVISKLTLIYTEIYVPIFFWQNMAYIWQPKVFLHFSGSAVAEKEKENITIQCSNAENSLGQPNPA